MFTIMQIEMPGRNQQFHAVNTWSSANGLDGRFCSGPWPQSLYTPKILNKHLLCQSQLLPLLSVSSPRSTIQQSWAPSCSLQKPIDVTELAPQAPLPHIVDKGASTLKSASHTDADKSLEREMVLPPNLLPISLSLQWILCSGTSCLPKVSLGDQVHPCPLPWVTFTFPVVS